MTTVVDEHEEVQELVARLVSLYLYITTKAVENEKAGGIAPTIDLRD